MNQLHHHSQSSSDGEDERRDDVDEKRAAVAQMMAENREGLGMKVIAIMVQRYGVLPKEFWDLNSISDMGAGRGITYHGRPAQKAVFKNIIGNDRYTILNLTIGKNVDHKVELPTTLLRLNILAKEYDYPLDFPNNLQGVKFGPDCCHNRSIIPPPGLLELELGTEYARPLLLSQRLQRLTFYCNSRFNLPVALPRSVKAVRFGKSYNRPTLLNDGVEVVRVGPAFSQELLLPTSVRKLEWWCNRPVHIPDSVTEVEFWGCFNQRVNLPASLKKITFLGNVYTHPLDLPSGLEELMWWPGEHEVLVLPDRLRKLTWASARNVMLPLGLKELVIEREAPLAMPDGLAKVTFDCMSRGRYNLPASVQTVRWLVHSKENIFAHPGTIRHLVMVHTKVNDEMDLSNHRVHKLTICHGDIRIRQWPQGLKELAFTVEEMNHLLRVPLSCRIAGKKWPRNVKYEEAYCHPFAEKEEEKEEWMCENPRCRPPKALYNAMKYL